MAIPERHQAFLDKACGILVQDSRIVGVAAGGSYCSGTLDEFSDLDLVIAVESESYLEITEERKAIAGKLGPLLAAFTGEHVGERRLLICLYGPPLLHVDLKFIDIADAAQRVEDPEILFDRDRRLRSAFAKAEARYPAPDIQWIEDRFWTWIHYCATKIARGELFEAVDGLAFLRDLVLGPLALSAANAQPNGVRKIEFLSPELAVRMRSTIAGYDARSCVVSLLAAVDLYRDLRTQATGGVSINREAETAVMDYLRAISALIE